MPSIALPYALRRGALSLSVVVSLSLGSLGSTVGCSFIFTQPAREADYREGRNSYCSTSAAPPLLDVLFAGTNVATAGFIAGDEYAPYRGARVALSLSVAAIWTASAIYGFSSTAKCREITEKRPVESYPRPRTFTAPFPVAPSPMPAAAPQVEPSPAAGLTPTSVPATAAPTSPPAPKPRPVPQEQDWDDPERRRPVPLVAPRNY